MNFELREDLDKDLIELLKKPEFNIYYDYLIEQNKLMNLTGLTEINDVYYKHFYDSIYLSKVIDITNKDFLDLGAGAGFPSLPLKIINNNFNLTIVDSLNKRIEFLSRLIDKLSLKNIILIHGRAEELEKNKQFDIVSARAVARLNILLELAMPLIKINGLFIAYKSINYQEELVEAKKAISVLGGEIDRIVEYNLSNDLKHVYIIIKKVQATPNKYPRPFAKIKKSPL
ncbi:MAG: 16S rRNA (guanine(527)-N(7))-methyltransferase RsmG [Candidatus Izimaplasma sp.]|nr:16S rRNA (guanine(527)-N(7))-methyltransferase RsmG [Candidatus Izimaplasma bacterium]